MSWKLPKLPLPKLVPRSAPIILLILIFSAAVAFAAVSHLVARFNANQQARGHRLYAEGLADASAAHYDDAIAAFRAALTCEPTNSQYQLSLARALRDSNDPTQSHTRLDEAESYLTALWQRTPQDAAVNLALARVAAHRGNIEDATRYYHNAMYGVWNSAPDVNRNKARVELIQFLLKQGAPDKAESELIALATALPPDPAAQLQAAQLFGQAHDDIAKFFASIPRTYKLSQAQDKPPTAPATTSPRKNIWTRRLREIPTTKLRITCSRTPNLFCASIHFTATSLTRNATAASSPPSSKPKSG